MADFKAVWEARSLSVVYSVRCGSLEDDFSVASTLLLEFLV
jgi:hypothetical protein